MGTVVDINFKFSRLDMIDFGIHVADNKTVYKTITVRNTGTTPTPYKIEYKGGNPIEFMPQSAVVQPRSSINVEVRISVFDSFYNEN